MAENIPVVECLAAGPDAGVTVARIEQENIIPANGVLLILSSGLSYCSTCAEEMLVKYLHF